MRTICLEMACRLCGWATVTMHHTIASGKSITKRSLYQMKRSQDRLNSRQRTSGATGLTSATGQIRSTAEEWVGISSLPGWTIVAVSTLTFRLSCLDRVLQPVLLVAYLNMTTPLPICATSCTDSLLGSELNVGWLHWYGVVCWALLVEFCGPTQSARSSRSLRSAEQDLLRGPFACTSTRQKRAFAVVGPQFGMASLCRSAHSLEPFLNLWRFYLVWGWERF